MRFAVAAVVPSGAFATISKTSRTYPTGAAGDRILGYAICGFNQIQKGRITVDVTSIADYTAAIVHKARGGFAEVNTRYFEFLLLLRKRRNGR